jgi:spermidine/putrescine transport system ATP-binding protein
MLQSFSCKAGINLDLSTYENYNIPMSETELLRLFGIKKRFGRGSHAVEVLSGLDLIAAKGEFITLLGSSGCGKTTTLRIIAGLESADSGSIWIDGRDVSSLVPNKRGVNMVFQNYALFPHMNVEQNIGYSLKLQGMSRVEIKKAVAEALALVRLSGFEKRKTSELSGGQRQRIAVARAVINRPRVLLLDEPLGALDLQLRRQMQIELKRLQKQLGITFIYITHDQEEALTMSDRVAVMRNGIFEQTGTPADIYNHPKTGFVAKFVGGANVLAGTLASCGGRMFFTHNAGRVAFSNETIAKAMSGTGMTDNGAAPGNAHLHLAIREEHIILSPRTCAADGHAANNEGLAATVTGKTFAGGLLRITARLHAVGGSDDSSDGNEISASRQGIDAPLEVGDPVTVSWLPANAIIVE